MVAQALSDKAVLRDLGGRLGRERLRRNVTQAELAHEAGVNKRTVERLEAGESVQLSSLIRVLRALDLTHRLGALLPEEEVTPMERLRGKGRPRERASRKRETTGKTGTWTWSDD